MEKKVEVGDFPELGEDLEERVPGAGRSYGEEKGRDGERTHRLMDGGYRRRACL